MEEMKEGIPVKWGRMGTERRREGGVGGKEERIMAEGHSAGLR